MTQFFAKKLNKKGFTLAEMLIVVAIIAILVAIAVPLFTSELEKAKIARDNANIRAVKSAAIVALLDESKGYDLSKKFYHVEAEVTSNGDIKLMTLNGTDSQSTDLTVAGKIKYSATISGTANIKVDISKVELSGYSSSGLISGS